MDSKKVILITGGYGFIGSHVVRHFVKKYPQYEIINFDALTYAGNVENLHGIEMYPNYRFFMGDIRNVKDIEHAFPRYGITDVIHLCAESHVDRSMVNPTVFAETNVMGTLNLLNAARKHWGESEGHIFFNMGTDEIFGALSLGDEPFNEKTPLDPHSPYSTSKTAAVMFGKTYYEAYGLPVINMACGNAIGPNQFPEKLVPLVIDRLIHRENIPVYGKGEQMRDWTNVHDIANAIDLVFHKGTPGEMYCIGGDAQRTNIAIINALIDEFVKQTGTHKEDLTKLITFIKDPRGKSHDFRYDIDHSKITSELGWKPEYTFEDSIKEVIEWYLINQPWTERVKSGEYKNWIKSYYKD